MKYASILIFLLMILNLACSKKQPKSIEKQEAVKKEIKSKKLVTVAANESLAKAVKNPALFPGYEISKYDYLDQTRLFEKINGNADGYIKNHGFLGCGYLELKSKVNNMAVIIYLMDMDKGIQAYGIYSNELNPKVKFMTIGTEGYFTRQGLNFWKNKYYVKLELQGKTKPEESQKILRDLANSLAKLISTDDSILNIFKLFPQNNRLRHGEKYYKGNYSGQAYFKNVYEVEYQAKKEDSENKIFITFVQDEKEAQEILKQYKSFLQDDGLKSVKKLKNGFSAKYTLEDDKRLLFLTGKNYLLGILGFADEKEQLKLADAIISKMK